jgi:hypothetical protein
MSWASAVHPGLHARAVGRLVYQVFKLLCKAILDPLRAQFAQVIVRVVCLAIQEISGCLHVVPHDGGLTGVWIVRGLLSGFLAYPHCIKGLSTSPCMYFVWQWLTVGACVVSRAWTQVHWHLLVEALFLGSAVTAAVACPCQTSSWYENMGKVHNHEIAAVVRASLQTSEQPWLRPRFH